MTQWDMYGLAAENLYVDTGKTLDDLTAIIPVTKQTLARWCAAQHWVAKRKARRVSVNAITNKIDQSIDALLSGDPVLDAGQADLLAKLAKTKDRLRRDDGEQTLQRAVEIMSKYLDFLSLRLLTPAEREPHIAMINLFLASLEERA